MGIIRKVVTGGLAVVAGLLVVSGTGAAAPTSSADERLYAACNVSNFPNPVTKVVWTAAPAYYIKGDGTRTYKGTVAAGNKGFYCQKNWGEGYRVTIKDAKGREYTNTWWALTNIKNAPNVWVNVVYLQGGNNNQPEPGVPTGT
ncbi:hypothetical protein AB0K14_14530 [Actinosynnema sp. NPDC050801]|uniref:hypothetical protein n=1 Tax=unclassified Actinosynnema TaxID=2637065 RepID=UPI0034016854